MFYHRFIKPLFFLLPAERAHGIAAFFLKLFSIGPFRRVFRLVFRSKAASPYRCMGLEFPSRLGLAAGFDKDATMYKALSAIGFGFIEVGTVTPLPQPGNEKPRLFRLPQDRALINRMGFNNRGLSAMSSKLRSKPKNLIIGGNIGKNKLTLNEEAIVDYRTCFEGLFDLVDYFTINVSSPNTPGLRELQEKKPLLNLLTEIQRINLLKKNPKPILLKIAPDLSEAQLQDIVEIIKTSNLAGVIATNTTISRDNLNSSEALIKKSGSGGLSGPPLKRRSIEVVKYLRGNLGSEFVIIGVGGISNGKEARDMISAGANLVQIYTSFIYGGPALVRDINKALTLV
ncbi:MAG: quinone-dependent dihydroorotate dehydrogenase [Vicingaceae bacterium]